jgi:hypothetical protein
MASFCSRAFPRPEVPSYGWKPRQHCPDASHRLAGDASRLAISRCDPRTVPLRRGHQVDRSIGVTLGWSLGLGHHPSSVPKARQLPLADPQAEATAYGVRRVCADLRKEQKEKNTKICIE